LPIGAIVNEREDACGYTCTVLADSCHVTFESDSNFEVSENVAESSQRNVGQADVRVLVHSDDIVNSVSV